MTFQRVVWKGLFGMRVIVPNDEKYSQITFVEHSVPCGTFYHKILQNIQNLFKISA